MKNLLFFPLLFISVCIYSQNDTIKLANNDILIGEFKKMDKSVVTFKTKYSDSDFKIKWGQVVEFNSSREFIIFTSNGERMTSTIHSVSGKEKTVEVEAGVNAIQFNLKEIVFMEPIGKNFLSRLTVDLDLGITVTKANNFKQLTGNLSATYLATKWRGSGFYKTVLSRQDGATDINRMDAELGGEYFLPNDWFVQLKAIYLSNDEQLLQLRSTYQAGGGYYFMRNNSMFFSGNAGLAYTSEVFSSDSDDRQSTEAYLGLGFNKYDIGDLSLLSGISLYPSLTQSGRYRVDFNFDLKYDLPLDFYIKMGATYNFDNQPVDGASSEDYVITTSFGWEWN